MNQVPLTYIAWKLPGVFVPASGADSQAGRISTELSRRICRALSLQKFQQAADKSSFDALAHTVHAFTGGAATSALCAVRLRLWRADWFSTRDGSSGTRQGHRLANGNGYEEGLGDEWAPIQR